MSHSDFRNSFGCNQDCPEFIWWRCTVCFHNLYPGTDSGHRIPVWMMIFQVFHVMLGTQNFFWQDWGYQGGSPIPGSLPTQLVFQNNPPSPTISACSRNQVILGDTGSSEALTIQGENTHILPMNHENSSCQLFFGRKIC